MPSNLALNSALIHVFEGDFAATPSNLALNLANNDRHPSKTKKTAPNGTVFEVLVESNTD